MLLVYLDFSTLLFLLGFAGLFFNRRNFLLLLLSLELTFLASALNFIFASSLLNLLVGSVYGIVVIILVVADTSIGLSLIVLAYRGSRFANAGSLVTLRG